MSFRQRRFFASTRNLFVIPTEKFFYFDEESYFYFNTEFLCFRYGEILQSPKISFRMTVAKCHSDDRRNLNVIPTEKFLLRRGIFLFLSREILQSRKRLFQNDKELPKRLHQNDSSEMSFRQRSFCFDEESFYF